MTVDKITLQLQSIPSGIEFTAREIHVHSHSLTNRQHFDFSHIKHRESLTNCGSEIGLFYYTLIIRPSTGYDDTRVKAT